jgi:hypothetical protein
MGSTIAARHVSTGVSEYATCTTVSNCLVSKGREL